MIGFEHDLKTCWNPHFHGRASTLSAKLLAVWYAKEYHGKTFHDLERFDVVPLCVFGGAVNSAYTCAEKSLGGTYAVCTACEGVTMCGWSDDGVTKACGSCARKFAWGDYYQAAVTGLEPTAEQLRSVIDPAKDPAVTVAEICAVMPEGIPASKVAPLIAILGAQWKIKTYKNLDYERYELRSSGVESDQVREAIANGRWTDLSPHRDCPVTVSKNGKIMLEARGIRRDHRARREIEIMLGYDGKRLKYEAISKLAALLMP